MPVTCSSRFRFRALFFPYSPKKKHLHCCSGCSCKAFNLFVVLIAIFVVLVLPFILKFGMGIELVIRKPDTLVTLFGTFTIAAIGYSAWARQKLLDLRTKMDKPPQDDQSTNSLSVCILAALDVFKSRVHLHMMFGSMAYGLFLLMFLVEKSLPCSWSDDIEIAKAIAVVWFIPNIFFLCTVGASLNDFLDDAPPPINREAGR